MVPSPEREARRGWEPTASSRRALVPGGIWTHSSSFTREKRRRQTCSPAPSPQPRSPRSRLPPRMSEEVTVPGANTKELPAHPALGIGQRRAGEGSGRPPGAAHAGPGPSRASPRARRKVSSQSPRHPLAQSTAEHNRLTAPEGGPRRPAVEPGPSVAPPSARAGRRGSPTTEPGEEQQREEQQQ